MLPIHSQESHSSQISVAKSPRFFQFLILARLVPMNVLKRRCLPGGGALGEVSAEMILTKLLYKLSAPLRSLAMVGSLSFLLHVPSISPSLLVSFCTGLLRSSYALDMVLVPLTTPFAFPSI